MFWMRLGFVEGSDRLLSPEGCGPRAEQSRLHGFWKVISLWVKVGRCCSLMMSCPQALKGPVPVSVEDSLKLTALSRAWSPGAGL